MNIDMIHSFDQSAGNYDAWYDQEPLLFQTEILALRKICPDPSGFSLEIGVGSGRFAQALNVQYGLDPSIELLKIAGSRGIEVIRAQGENVPFKDGSFFSVFIIFTLMFTEDPLHVVRECRRILLPGGNLIIMCINATSSWGKLYDTKKKEGHPLYKYAHFFTPSDLQGLLKSANFGIAEEMCTLRQKPGKLFVVENPENEIYADAGVVLLRGTK